LSVTAALKINGILHVQGDLDVKGSVTLSKGSQLIVDGKRTIHGSIKQEE
jgi:cytoskeletal protein CcmA (bactofilin family)